MTGRQSRRNVIRIDLEAFDGQTAFDSFNDFSIGPSPGYQLHLGTRNSSYNLRESKL